MKSSKFRLQITIAIIGLVGVISTAVISNWDKLFLPEQKHAPLTGKPLSQSSVASNSPNVANVQGNVNININNQPQLNVPSFNREIDSTPQANAFEEFIDGNRGKIVHINVVSSDLYSEISHVEQGTYFGFTTKPCDSEGFFTECLMFGLKINGNDYILEWYKGDNRMTGFFAIEENLWMHQGVYYILKAIPRETVLLQTQRTP